MFAHQGHRVLHGGAQWYGNELLRAYLVSHDLAGADMNDWREELVFLHPVVVIDLAQVARAGVRNDDDDDVLLRQCLRGLQCNVQGRA